MFGLVREAAALAGGTGEYLDTRRVGLEEGVSFWYAGSRIQGLHHEQTSANGRGRVGVVIRWIRIPVYDQRSGARRGPPWPRLAQVKASEQLSTPVFWLANR